MGGVALSSSLGPSMPPSQMRFPGTQALCALVVVVALSFFAPAQAAPLPTDNEQEILIKTTLMTFNDANLTGNYSVLHERSAKLFRAQMTVQKLADAFKVFRDKKVDLSSIVADEIDSSKAPVLDAKGVLTLKGRFKDDEKKIRFDLQFVDEGGAWKLVGINVDYKQE